MFHDIHLTAQRNFSKFEGVGMQKPRENVLLAILIANNAVFCPLSHREKLFPPILVYKGLHTMFHDIHLTAQRNFSKFEGVGMQKPRENVLLAILILIANNTFWSLITRFLALSFAWGGGGLKVVKIKKKINFGFCYPKAFQGCNKKIRGVTL